MKKILIIILLIANSCSATGENKRNNLKQESIVGIWSFVSNPVGAVMRVSSDGVIVPNSVTFPLSSIGADDTVVITADRSFIVGDPTAMNYNIYHRENEGVGNSNVLNDGTAIYKIHFVRGDTLIISQLSTGENIEFTRWVKIRRSGDELLTSPNFATPEEAVAISFETIIRPLASLRK